MSEDFGDFFKEGYSPKMLELRQEFIRRRDDVLKLLCDRDYLRDRDEGWLFDDLNLHDGLTIEASNLDNQFRANSRRNKSDPNYEQLQVMYGSMRRKIIREINKKHGEANPEDEECRKELLSEVEEKIIWAGNNSGELLLNFNKARNFFSLDDLVQLKDEVARILTALRTKDDDYRYLCEEERSHPDYCKSVAYLEGLLDRVHIQIFRTMEKDSSN